ncbi:MAG TPA: DUF2341 domain-containing protein [Ktedonobacteraceae bacterium]|jgi:hypothetical protein|nr:DUF2341 domain-containing protein [Ktedonobacteraceae bacterium]
MTVTTLTVTVAGSTYNIFQGSFKLSTKIDERSTCDFVIRDDNSAFLFQKGQQVTISDTLQGTIFTGFINTSQINKVPGNNTMRYHTIACIDNHFIADKRTSNRVYTNQYGGVIVAGMVNDVLAAEGVSANYAIREDNNQADFGQGTLAGTMATPNLGGDLELNLAGSQVNIVEDTTSNFSTGSLTNTTAANNSLIPTATPAIKLVGTQSLTGDGNAYTYIQFFSGGGITVVGSRYLVYDVWIDPASPSGQVGVDIVFTDGTTLRDAVQDYRYYDSQNIPPHPSQEIGGNAKGKWYHRSFLLDNFSGKTIAYLTVVLEGNSSGTYTAYFKNILEVDSGGSTVNTFFSSTFDVNPPRQLFNSGYSNVSCTIVDTYDFTTASRVSSDYSIGAVSILRSSFISWQVTEPEKTSVQVEYSLDGGNSFTICQNNVALPNLPAGLSLTGKTLTFKQTFQQVVGASPESAPALNSLQVTLDPSYTATKSDVTWSGTTNAEWNAPGMTFTNTQVPGTLLILLQVVREWSTADLSGLVLFGASGSGPGPTTIKMFCNRGVLWVATGVSMEGHARADFAGSWQAGRIDCDIYFDRTDGFAAISYRGTNDSNWDANYAYSVQCALNTVSLQKGSNSSASSTGTRTQVASASTGLTTASWHHVTIIFNGTNHQVWVDDTVLINSTDGTYTASGKISFRASNANVSSGYQGQFNNFGVTVVGLNGTFKNPSTSLTGAGTYLNSVVSWQDESIGNQSTNILVESTINGGSSFQTVTNGGPIPNLTLGQSLSGISFQLKVTLTTASASAAPQLQSLVARVLGGYSSSGTRISPVLSLASALVAGATVVNWSAITPPNTTVVVATSPDNVTYTNVLNGGPIAGITTQPPPVLDTFAIDSHLNYVSTFKTSGVVGTWNFDTANSRVTINSGTSALLLYSPVWFNTSYLNKKQIIISHTKVIGGSDLTNFNFPISMVDPQLATVDNGGYVHNINGFDIIFVDSTETIKLDHEIESYNPVTGEIEMWIRIPTLSHTVDTVLYIYFNNASISTTQEAATSVWDSNYKAVWHMDAVSGANQLDSTSNAQTAVQNNAPVQTSGKIDGGFTFDGLADYFSVAGAAVDITGDKTIELWINAASFAIDSNGADPRILINNIDGTNVYQFALDAAGGGTIAFAVNDATGQHIIASQAWNINTWYHLVGTYVASSHTVVLYINGAVAANNGSLSLALGTSSLFNIGRRTDALGYYLGSIDEVRVSNVVRTPGWIATTYSSQANPSAFFAVGALTSQSSVSVKDIDVIVDADQINCGGLVWRQTDASNFYELDLFDSASNAGSINTLKLFKVVANVKTQLGTSTAITFNRGTPYRIRAMMVGTAITIFFDGNSVISTTDSSLVGPGKVGLIHVSGTGGNGDSFHNLRIQPLGQSLSGINAYTRITMMSADPEVTPQLTNLVLAALHPNINLGALIPTASYLFTYISANNDDIAKKSNTYWVIDKSLNIIFASYQAIPAPWILTNKDILVAGPQALQVTNNGDLYRNRQNITGVVATGVGSEFKTGDSTTRSWTLGGILIDTPTIYLNDQLQAVGVKGIDTGKDFYWTLDSAVIDQDASGKLLQPTDRLSFPSYTYQFTTTVTVDNIGQFPGTTSQAQFAALSGGTGIVEETTDVSSQNLNMAAATALANELLQRNGVIGNEIQFSTLRSGLAIGQYLPIFNPETSMNDISALITSIDMTQTTTLDPASGNPTQMYWYAVTCEMGPNAGSWMKLLASTVN